MVCKPYTRQRPASRRVCPSGWPEGIEAPSTGIKTWPAPALAVPNAPEGKKGPPATGGPYKYPACLMLMFWARAAAPKGLFWGSEYGGRAGGGGGDGGSGRLD